MTIKRDANTQPGVFLPTCYEDGQVPLSVVTSLDALAIFEHYPIKTVRIQALESAKSLWHNATPEERVALHAWAQQCINTLLFIEDSLWEQVANWYLETAHSDEDSIIAINFLLGLDLDVRNNIFHSQKVYEALGKKFQCWQRSGVDSRNFHQIPYSQIERFRDYVLQEFENFANSITPPAEPQNYLGHDYHGWERAHVALQIMLVYAKTERELLPEFCAAVEDAINNFKEYVIPESGTRWDPLQEGARLGVLEYAAQTLRQTIQRSE